MPTSRPPRPAVPFTTIGWLPMYDMFSLHSAGKPHLLMIECPVGPRALKSMLVRAFSPPRPRKRSWRLHRIMSEVIFPNSTRAIPKTQTEREADQARADHPAQSGYAVMPDPPDEPGDEMTYGARVWRTYVREADQADKELVVGRNNSLDVLLIFAALFSAISTAFIIESLDDLKPDPAESSAQTLLAISRTLAAISNGQPVDSSSLGSVDTPTFSPSGTAIAVNALWFLSLSLSVAVSLIAMLAKEWCYMFLSRRSGPMYEQARRRQERWNGIERWKMKEIVTYLPGLMHLALLLFAIGLSIYLWDVNKAVAIPVVLLTIIASIIYSGITVVSFFDKFCPYTTPATPLLHITRYELILGVEFLCSKISDQKWSAVILQKAKRIVENRNPNSYKPYDTDIKVPMDDVTGQMLEWLVTNCEDSRSVNIAVQALAGASPELLRGPFGRSELIGNLSGRIFQYFDKCHIGTDNEYIISDQRRLELVMLNSRINNNLLSWRTDGGTAGVSWTWIDREYEVLRSHHEISVEVNEMLLKQTESIKNPNALALVVASAMSVVSSPKTLILPGTKFHRYLSWIRSVVPEITLSLLQEHLSSARPRLSPNALHALVESSVHYLVGIYPLQSVEERQILVPLLLARLYFALPSSSEDLRTIAVALAATAFATRSFPGGEEPSNDIESRRRRAFKVINHYQVNPPDDESTLGLFHLGFVEFLSEMPLNKWSPHAHTIQDLLKSLNIRKFMPRHWMSGLSIHTLQTYSNTTNRQILAVSRCLVLFSRSTFTQDAEKAMTTSSLQPFLSENILVWHSNPKLYSAALVALRYAQSIELQRFCLRVISCQPALLPSEMLVQEVSEHLVLSHLKYISKSNRSDIVPVSIIQATLLVAAILLSTGVPSTVRQTALKTMIEQESSLDQQPADIANYTSRLSEAIDQTSGPQALQYIVQCAAEFYHATTAQQADMDAKIVADAGRYEWNEKLQRFKDSYEPEPLSDDSPNELEPDTQDPVGGGTEVEQETLG